METPYDQIRSCIEELKTFELKELSGMFCEYLQEALGGSNVTFDGAKFECMLEEPYNVFYSWDFGDAFVDVTIAAGRDGSRWSVRRDKDGRKSWRKGDLSDFEKGTLALVKELEKNNS